MRDRTEIENRKSELDLVELRKTKQRLRDLFTKPEDQPMREWLTELEEAWNKKAILEARIGELAWVLEEIIE